MKLIIVSKTNIASRNISKFLKNLPEAVKIFETDKSVLDFDKDKNFSKLTAHGPELIIVASTHRSEAGVNTLTCHSPGNLSDDVSHGGYARALSIAPALYLRGALLELSKLKAHNPKLSSYQVSLEVTHHGPTISLPIIFVEVGSSEKQWNDLEACEAVAKTITKLVSEQPETKPIAIGFGGGHYAPQFTKKVLAGEIALGHICPKYAADNLDEEMILQMLNKTIPKPEYALMEWKGLAGEQKNKIKTILDKNKIRWEKF